MRPPVYAVEITAYDPALPGTRVLTYASGEGFATAPGDTPADAVFEPRVANPGNVSQFLVNAQLTDGRSRAGAGEIVLANPDGALDALNTYGLDGRRVVVRRGTPGTPYPAAWETVFTGTMEQAEFTWGELSIITRDRQGEVADRPYQPTKFDGSNTLPNGVEGVAGDLQGKPKPVLRGKARNVAPPHVNTSKLTFQVSHRQIASLDAVYVGGNAISAGTTHGSLAALQAATPGAGTFDAYLGSGADGAYFRLGTAPDNVVTCDATEGATAADRTAAQIASDVLTAAGIDPGDIDAASVAALDAATDAVVGYWSGTAEETAGAVLDAVLGSVGGYWCVGPTGTFFLGRLEEPAGTPAETIEAYQLLDEGGQPVERVRARAADKGLPCWRVTLGYRRNWTVQTGGDVVPAVAQARRAALAEEWATVTAEDAAVQTQHLLAPERRADTLIDDPAEAAAEAARQLALHKERRDFLRVRRAASDVTRPPRLGEVVELAAARFDWAGGKLFVRAGLTFDFGTNTIIEELWG